MKPPAHRIDAQPVLVRATDPAWDLDRLDAELDSLDPAERSAHPWAAYMAAGTRYDLHADAGNGSAADYLRPGSEPVAWTLRRLSVTQMARVQDMFSREIRREGESSLYEVWVECVRCGLEDVTGPGAPRLEHRQGKLTEASLSEIHDHCGGLAALAEIGAAIFHLSQPLTDAEKKR